nr:diaminopimelate dehydrogenase [Maliibacterium massiliense]
MTKQTRIGIVGYGNLGRGVELAVGQNPDMTLAAVFTRRDPGALAIRSDAAVCAIDDAENWQDRIDVMILCGGSATDLPQQGPRFAALFNTIDSFDTHANIPAYFDAVDKAAQAGGHLSVISVGWDPGMFSINRAYAEAVLPHGATYTFWGKGLSQGHSDALRRIPGVKDAVQYTIPVKSALEAVRAGAQPALTTREKHTRECYVVLEEGADQARVRAQIVSMPNYFADYDTTVHFISQQELRENHRSMAHGGFVMRSGTTGPKDETRHLIEYSLKLDSNPQFTASVLVAYARAAHRLSQEGARGARTVLDIAPAYLSPKSGAELRGMLL